MVGHVSRDRLDSSLRFLRREEIHPRMHNSWFVIDVLSNQASTDNGLVHFVTSSVGEVIRISLLFDCSAS